VRNNVQMGRGQRSKTTSAAAAAAGDDHDDDDDDESVWQTLLQLEEDVTGDQPWNSKYLPGRIYR